MALDVELIGDAAGLERVRGEWERLYGEDPGARPSHRPEFVASYARHFAGLGPLRVALAREDGRAVGLLPLQVRTERLGRLRLPVRVLRFAGAAWSSRNTGVFAPGASRPRVLGAMLRALRQADRGWLSCRLEKLPAALAAAPPADADGFAFARRAVGHSVVIEPGPSYEAYLKALARSHRGNISRSTRHLEEVHALRLARLGLEPDTDPAALDRLLDDALAVSGRSWQAAAGEGTAISSPAAAAFFRDVSRRLSAHRALDLSVLYADGRPISFVWGTARWPGTSIEKIGFDAGFERWSPGTVHLARLVEDSIRRGAREIDFGHEFPEYKARWSRRADELCDLRCYPPGLLPGLIRRWRDRPRPGALPAPAPRAGP
jgi:CelD/BcsL family acetyltransferase involved in cellulose biosynthesis